MVLESTDVLLAGIISGWVIAVTQKIIDPVFKYLIKMGLPESLVYPLGYLIWLLGMMSFVVIVYG